MYTSRGSQSIKISIDLSIDESINIGKTDLIDIDYIDQSVEIDDTLVSFILIFTDFIDLYRSLMISFHLFIQKFNTFKALTRDDHFVPGAGATEIELAKQISSFGEVR